MFVEGDIFLTTIQQGFRVTLVVETILSMRPSPFYPKARLCFTYREGEVNIRQEGIGTLRPMRGIDEV